MLLQDSYKALAGHLPEHSQESRRVPASALTNLPGTRVRIDPESNAECYRSGFRNSTTLPPIPENPQLE